MLAVANVFCSLQPDWVSQTMLPSVFSKLHVQVRGPSPVERVPSSVTGVPTVAPAGAVQTAATVAPGDGVVAG